MEAVAEASLNDDITSVVERAIRDRVFPGAVVGVALHGGDMFSAHGTHTYAANATAVTSRTMFDVASLTKVFATVTAVMQLVEQGTLRLDEPACRLLPELAGDAKRGITLAHLLTHMAGFPQFIPNHRSYKTPAALLDAIASVELVYRPGHGRIYDDIAYILLGLLLERATGMRLDDYCRDHIFRPLDMIDTMFLPPPPLHDRIAPTEDDAERGLLWGVVHDDNAFTLGGVAGHAGLFSTAHDLIGFCKMLLRHRNAEVLSGESIRRLRERLWRDEDGEYGLGWDRLRPSYMGAIDDRDAIGHTGFTGTSIVVSARRDLAIVLLTNRVHPARSDRAAIDEVRRELATTIIRRLDRRSTLP